MPNAPRGIERYNLLITHVLCVLGVTGDLREMKIFPTRGRICTPGEKESQVSPMDEKSAIRRRMLDQRRAIPLSEYLKESARIFEWLRTIPEVNESPSLLTYVSSKDNEVDTWAIIQWALNRGQQVFVPKTAPQRSLVWRRIGSLQELKRSAFGIFEPCTDISNTGDPPSGAPVLVPGLAFSRHGYRLGYGAGYFDHFLADYRGHFIGLAFRFQLLEELPVSPHDIPVHRIITETEIISCGRP